MRTTTKIAITSSLLLLSLPNDYSNYASKILAAISTANYPLIRPHLLSLYSRAYAADIVPADLESPNFYEFFTRQRSTPISLGSNFTSPCDGQLFWQGTCQVNDDIGGMTLKDVLKLDNNLDFWDYYILYLGPGDYHRFHAPVDCKFDSILHFRGPLKPVAPWYFQFSLKPFSENERIILYGSTMDTNLRIVYSAIGALHVGSILINNAKLHTNRSTVNHLHKIDPLIYDKGDEIGRFALGSCIVMAKQSQNTKKRFEIINKAVKVGEDLASI
eukprot:NODE_33_length_32023_cov_0.217579.p10 type:complete len:273 gc:universal NODE_33_length_32023_cov_0.217579:31368-30550(-)